MFIVVCFLHYGFSHHPRPAFTMEPCVLAELSTFLDREKPRSDTAWTSRHFLTFVF